MKLHSNDRFCHQNILYFKIRAIDRLNPLQASHSEKSVYVLILRKIKTRIFILFALQYSIEVYTSLIKSDYASG